MTICERLKSARAALGLKQTEMAAQSGVSARGYQGYEDGRSIPGGEAIAGLVRTGINANWLLTGEGPMLLADLAPKPVETAPVPPAPKINIDAFAAILEGTMRARPNASPAAIARQSVEFYVTCIEDEVITPDGIGNGNLSSAA